MLQVMHLVKLLFYPSTQRGFVKIEVTSAAKAWKSGSPNYGVVIWATNENVAGRDTRFTSNADINNPSQHAYIFLDCSNDDGGSHATPALIPVFG